MNIHRILGTFMEYWECPWHIENIYVYWEYSWNIGKCTWIIGNVHEILRMFTEY